MASTDRRRLSEAEPRRVVLWLNSRGRIGNSDTEPFYEGLLAAWERFGAGFVGELGESDG